MDILNDHYPLYPDNPDPSNFTEQEQQDAEVLIKKRKKQLTFDDYCAVYSDDLWYLWCMVQEFRESSNKSILDTLDYPSFCRVCYDNCTGY
jgi:hypothetical protein